MQSGNGSGNTRAAEAEVDLGDRDPAPEAVRPRPFGFGLRLVSQLSLDWGVRADPGGKVGWALVPLDAFPAGMYG